VTPLRARIIAVALVATSLATTGSLFAQQLHDVCTARQHRCGEMARITQCCCGEQSLARHESTPVQVRVEERVEFTAIAAVPNAELTIIAPVVGAFIQPSPPRLKPLDLPTLFATLLI
jgi:hypothetical protein